MINTNWHPISYRFGVIAAYCSNFGHFTFLSHPLRGGGLRDNVRCSSWAHLEARGVCVSLYLSTSRNNYWSDLHENSTRYVSVHKKNWLNFGNHPRLDALLGMFDVRRDGLGVLCCSALSDRSASSSTKSCFSSGRQWKWRVSRYASARTVVVAYTDAERRSWASLLSVTSAVVVADQHNVDPSRRGNDQGRITAVLCVLKQNVHTNHI